ncbi:hypothetical protein CesoFtcFv8_006702 [Champsocephalus esox]|uniref:Uncharacterized protein n=1 Tax=Champsocephalus esox TaxID=159716 RepID=A0AAN8CK61_9TELE|nr:hypothetical protein CesoFtcFv8_006702 [Champsocephalus esox]
MHSGCVHALHYAWPRHYYIHVGDFMKHFTERGRSRLTVCLSAGSPALLGASQLLSGCFNIHDKLESWAARQHHVDMHAGLLSELTFTM